MVMLNKVVERHGDRSKMIIECEVNGKVIKYVMYFPTNKFDCEDISERFFNWIKMNNIKYNSILCM